ncbi:MAG: hypothetical protein E3J47_05730 [Candidatus Stahlbacteria bacterium]|nr:MAG: hypothetical protein E3J47_05730 [Candidatus Stahlbacteria bacterium]
MKLKHCFIDEHGRIWRDSTLIEASKGIEAKPFDVEKISLDETIRWKISNLRDYVAHYKRVQEADCSIPIILRSDGYPMDGWHRIIKAKATGKALTARQFVENPKPDFTSYEDEIL